MNAWCRLLQRAAARGLEEIMNEARKFAYTEEAVDKEQPTTFPLFNQRGSVRSL